MFLNVGKYQLDIHLKGGSDRGSPTLGLHLGKDLLIDVSSLLSLLKVSLDFPADKQNSH